MKGQYSLYTKNDPNDPNEIDDSDLSEEEKDVVHQNISQPNTFSIGAKENLNKSEQVCRIVHPSSGLEEIK